MTQKYNRIVSFSRSCNFRDIGGIPITTGKYMKQRVLYRSGSLHKLTDEDREKLNELGIKLICDLRTPKERKGKADRLHKNSNTRIASIPIYHLGYKTDPGRLRKYWWFLTTGLKNFDYIQFMKEYYSRIAFNHPNEIRKVLALIADEKNLPALIHCSGGKDRTGWLAAVLQLLLGVSMDLVYDDYILTNKHLEFELYEPGISIILFNLFNMNLKDFQPLIELRIEYLQVTLDMVFSKYRTIETYLLEGCGISLDIINRLKKFLTADP